MSDRGVGNRAPRASAAVPRLWTPCRTIWGLVPLVALGALIPAPAHIPVQMAILHIPQPVAILRVPQSGTILHVPQSGAVIGHGHVDPSHWVIVCWMIGAGLLAWVQWYQQRTFVRRLGMVLHDDTGEWVSDALEIGPVVVGVFPPKIVLPSDFRHRYTPAIVASCLVSSGFAWTSQTLPPPVTKDLFRVRPQTRFLGMADSQMKGDPDSNYYGFQGIYRGWAISIIR